MTVTTTTKHTAKTEAGKEIAWYTCNGCQRGSIAVSANYCPGCGRKINWRASK